MQFSHPAYSDVLPELRPAGAGWSAGILRDDLLFAPRTGHFTRSKSRLPPSTDVNTVLSFAVSVQDDLPLSIEEALSDNNWTRAVTSEYDALIQNGTWELVPRRPGQAVVGCRWLFKIKRAADGSIARYKARLVAQGFTQVFGVNYSDTFAPVSRIASVRIILAIAGAKQFRTFHTDIRTAFLNAPLSEEVYMRQPFGFEQPGPGGTDLVCRLKKCLYGLKQSPREWRAVVDAFLRGHGFTPSPKDPCLYVLRREEAVMALSLYVDDMIGFYSRIELYQEFTAAVNSAFSAHHDDAIQWVLGMGVQHSPQGITVTQTQYIVDLLDQFGLTNAKFAKVPLTQRLSSKASDESPLNAPYRELVGSLLYICVCTRPDIAYSVSQLCHQMANPSVKHWEAAKGVLRYLSGTRHIVLHIRANSPLTLQAFSDADWASDTSTGLSISGMVVTLAGTPIFWRSKQQTIIAMSSTESEYMALAATCLEILYFRELLAIFPFIDSISPTVIHTDNQSSIRIAEADTDRSRTRHIAVRFHCVRARVHSGEVTLRYLPTAEMPADILTKPIMQEKLVYLRAKLLSG